MRALPALLTSLALATACLLSTALAAGAPVPLLWTLEGGDSRVHLLGSIHVLRAEDYPLAPEVEDAFAAAGQVVFELDPEEALSPAAGMALTRAAQASPDQALPGLLEAEEYAALRRLAAAKGVPDPVVSGFQPWFVSLALALGAASQAGLEAGQGVDMVLMRRALEAGKATGGLERGQDQIRALSGAPLEEQLLSLRRMIAAPGRLREDTLHLHALWREGDGAGLLAAIEDELAEQPETYRRINVERNAAWLPQIEALALGDGDEVLVVVGALHLLGEDGLVEGLRARGWRVARVGATVQAEARASAAAAVR